VSVQAGGPEGWREDPYGRHEVRFYDGTRWTPYVRDGETNTMDEPIGVMTGGVGASAGALLAEELLVVERHGDSGRRRERAVRRADGTTAALLRAATGAHKPTSALRSLVVKDQFTSDALELVDETLRPVLTLLRPIGDPKGTVVVRDAEGREAGRIARQEGRDGGSTYALLSSQSAFLGDLRTDDWAGWDLRVQDTRGREVATLTEEWGDLDRSAFGGTGAYVVRLAQPLPDPLRMLVLAAAVSYDALLRL